MATLGSLVVELHTDLAKFQQDMGKAAGVAEKTAKRIEGVMKGVGGALAGIGAGMAFKAIVDEAGEAEQSLKQLQQTIASTGGVAGVSVKAVTEMSASMQRLTGVSDDAINSMASILLTFTKIGKQVFPDASKAIVDMSAKLGQDLKASAIQVGKALNDPVKGVSALQKVGVSFTAGQKAMIKSLVDSGDTLKAQRIIIRELQTEFGGAAAAARDTLKGAMDALGVAAKDVLENIGASQGQGLRGGIEFLIELCNQAAAHADVLAKAMQGVAAGLTAVVAIKAFGEIQKIGTALAALGTVNAGLVIGVAAVVTALVAFRDEQATLIGSTKTWGQLTVEAFTGIATIAKPVINGIIDSFVEFGKWVGATAKLVVEVLGGAFRQVFRALGQEDLFEKVSKGASMFMSTLPGAMKAFADTANKQSAAAGKDYVGNFFNPILKLASDAKQRMDDIGKAAARGAKVRVNVGETPEVMSKEAQKAAEKAKKLHEADQKSLTEILGTMKQQNDELTLRLAKNKEMIPELEAQNKLAKLGHLTEKERTAAMTEINKLAAERRELEKQISIKGEGDQLTQMLTAMKERTAEIQNAGKKQGELNISLKAQAEIDKIIKVGKTEHLDLVNQILSVAKEQEALLKEQKRQESLEKYGSTIQDLADQNAQLRLKISGQEEFLPLLEQEKKIREIMKDQNLSDDDKTQLISQVRAAATETVQYNKALENQDVTLKMIKDSSASVKQRIASLQMAFATGQVNVKQYRDTLMDLQKEGFKNLKSDAKEFSDIMTKGLDTWVTKGGKFTDILKNIGKEMVSMSIKKLGQPLFENVLSGIGAKLFGNRYGINQQNPTGLPTPGGVGSGGILAGGGTVPTTLAEGPAIVSLLQQILVALGGTPMGTPLGGLGVPQMGPSFLPGYQQSSGGLLSRVGGMFRGMFGGGGGGGFTTPEGLAGGYPAGGTGGGGLLGGLRGLGGTLSGGALGLLRAIGTPFFAGGGFLPAGHFGVVGDQGPELAFGGQYGMNIMSNQMAFGGASPMLPRAGSFAFGMGGMTTSSQISFQDDASIKAQIAKQMYDAAYAKAQIGEFPMGWQLENLRNAAQIAAQEAASGQSRSFYTRPDYAPQWDLYNSQIKELQALGGNFNLEAALPAQLRGMNTGAMWGGFQAGGVSSSSMGGDVGISWGGGDFGPAVSNFTKGSSFAGGGYNPMIAAHTPGASAFSTPFNGGAPLAGGGIASMNAGMGPIRSWNDALVRLGGGGGAQSIQASSAWISPYMKSMDISNLGPGSYINSSGQIVYGPDTYTPRSGTTRGWSSHAENVDRGGWGNGGRFSDPNSMFGTGEQFGPFQPNATADQIRMGQDYLKRLSEASNQTRLAPDMVMGMRSGDGPLTMADMMRSMQTGYYGAGQVAPGTNLPWQLADMIPVQMQSTIKNVADGFNLIDAMNPSNFMPRGMLQSMGMSALGQAAAYPQRMSDLNTIFAQPWANRNMPTSAYDSALSLFGMRGFKHGGRPHRNEVIEVGEAGRELFVPDTDGRIIPNNKVDSFNRGGGGANIVVNTYTRTPLQVKQKQTERGTELVIEDIVEAVAQRSGAFNRTIASRYGLQSMAVGRS